MRPFNEVLKEAKQGNRPAVEVNQIDPEEVVNPGARNPIPKKEKLKTTKPQGPTLPSSAQRAKRFSQSFGTPTGANPFTGKATYVPPEALTKLPPSGKGTVDPKAYSNVTPGDLEIKRNVRTAEVPGKPGVRAATPKGVENFLLSRGGYARPDRNMSASEFKNRRAEAERILANPGGAEYKKIETKINQEVGGRRIKRGRNSPAGIFADAEFRKKLDLDTPEGAVANRDFAKEMERLNRQNRGERDLLAAIDDVDAKPSSRQGSQGRRSTVSTSQTPSQVIAQTQQTKRLEAPKVEQPAAQPAAQTSRTRQVPTSTRTTAQIKATSATSRPAVLRPLTKPTPVVPAASKPAPIAPAPAKPVAATPAPAPVKPVAAPAPSPKPVAVRPAPAPRPRSISVRAPRTSVITPSVLSKELAKNRVLTNTQATARNAAGLKTVAKGLTAVTAYFDFDRAKKATLAQGGGDRRATAKGAVEAGARILGTGAGAILGTPLGPGGQVLGAVGGGETAVNFAGKAFDRVFGKAGQAVTRQTVKANLKDIYREKTPETVKQVVSKVKDATPEPIKKTFKQFASDTLGYVNKAYKGYRRFEKAMDFTKKEGK
jgi:hypothetical protein